MISGYCRIFLYKNDAKIEWCNKFYFNFNFNFCVDYLVVEGSTSRLDLEHEWEVECWGSLAGLSWWGIADMLPHQAFGKGQLAC